MSVQHLSEILSQNAYPGRGIVLGITPDAGRAVVVYFIMGRSENSRNRVFTVKDDGLITEAADPAKLADPSLILYSPVRTLGSRTIVTNGDQTDTLYNCLSASLSFEHALRSRTFEPDTPHYTPRLSGLLTHDLSGFFYQLSILKTAAGSPHSTQRFFYDYTPPLAGVGHFIHTYARNTEPLPSFYGEPIAVAMENDIDRFGTAVWESLNEQNKVSLFVRYLGQDDSEETRVYNRFAKI